MDGGGFVLEPLTAGPSGGGTRPSPFFASQGAPSRSVFSSLRASSRSWGFRRRSSVAVPLAGRLPAHLGTGLTLAFFAAVIGYGVVAGGQYTLIRDTVGEPRDVIARALGLGLNKITISGLGQLTEREVLGIAGISPRVSLPFLSASEIRAKLEESPLVQSASVRKLFPHELVINLVERTPFALWQKNGELFIVSADGTVIDKLRDQRFSTLPLVVGGNANARAADYTAILDAAGPLKNQIRAGMLISGRRWTLKMNNGTDVRLPEEGATVAVARLARLERDQKILEKDVLAIDLRMPDRVVVRLTEEAAAAHVELMKKKPVRGTKGLDT
jgi:cell division protein FtsQ